MQRRLMAPPSRKAAQWTNVHYGSGRRNGDGGVSLSHPLSTCDLHTERRISRCVG